MMQRMIGQSIAHYRITAKLGEGGMGAVWRATDSKLGRDVALKICDERFSERFAREAQVLASLNHPNIAAIYGLEQNAIVMELVEGETLAGPLPPDRALAIARQLAEAFEYAHEKGVIHRDLKPANIKITPEGVVKVLDFGLAKVAAAETIGPDQPTLTLRYHSQVGAIMGTPAYMSPEQARGQAVDRRSDIWAFGVVLYELLAGRQAFTGETVTDLLAAVVRSDPDWSALPDSTPPRVRKLLDRCLRKDVKTRLQAIGEARILIDEPAEEIPETTPLVQARRPWLPWALAAVALLAGGIGWYRATRPAPLAPLVRLSVELDPDTPLSVVSPGMMALSPDGSRLVVALRGPGGVVRLYKRLLQEAQLTPIAGTENASGPFFSPAGDWIGFTADGKLKKVSLDGGAAVTVCEVPRLRGASWGDDDNIVLAPTIDSGLVRVPAGGGTPAPLTTLRKGERTHRWPQLLPGSQAVLFTAHFGSANYDAASVDAVSLKTGERKTLVRGGFSGRYLPTTGGAGQLIYMHQGTLFAAPFDLGRLALAGAAVPVLEHVASSGNAGGEFTFSPTGTLVYREGKGRASGWTIAWIDSSGRTQPLHSAPGGYYSPRWSPDGKRIAFSMSSAQGLDIWVKDIDRDTPSRLTFLDGVNSAPVWTPDGKSIVFKSSAPKAPGLYWIRADGAGEPQRLSDGAMNVTPSSISPDGKRLAMEGNGRGGSVDIFTASIEGDPAHPRLGKPELLVSTPSTEESPAFSPDGRWLAYMSVESGSAEVYVRPFPGPGGKWQISAGGGGYPRWSRDGRELLFQGPDLRVMAVSYTAKGDSFAAGKPRLWSETRVMDIGGMVAWDLAPDGKRLAVFRDDLSGDPKPPTHLTFLLNFSAELQRRAASAAK